MELPRGRLLAIRTDRALVPPNWTLAQAVAQSVGAGANLVIFAEEDLPRPARLALARFVGNAVHGRCPWVVAGDASLALEAGAAGYCLDAGDEGPEPPAGTLLRGARIASVEAIGMARAADYAVVEVDWSRPESATGTLERACSVLAGVVLLAGTDPPLEAVDRIMELGLQGIVLSAYAMDGRLRGRIVEAYAARLWPAPPK